MDVTPGIKSLKMEVKDTLRDILNKAPYITRDGERIRTLQDIDIVDEYTAKNTDNNAIYISVKSFSDNPTGIDNYGGVRHSNFLLANKANTDFNGTSIQWVHEDPSKYDQDNSKGYYFISIKTQENSGNGTYEYIKVVDKSEVLTESYLENETNTLELPEVPIDPSTVKIWFGNYLLIRTEHFTVSGSTVSFVKSFPQGMKVTANWKIQEGQSVTKDYESGRTSEIIPGITLYFNESVVLGDEQVLILLPDTRPCFHVFTSRGRFEVGLHFSLPDKKKEIDLFDFLLPRLKTELSSTFHRSNWSVLDINWSDEDLETWTDDDYLKKASSTMTFSVDLEWARFVPMDRMYHGFIFVGALQDVLGFYGGQ
jgi:hypothetical protein